MKEIICVSMMNRLGSLVKCGCYGFIGKLVLIKDGVSRIENVPSFKVVKNESFKYMLNS